MAAGGVVALLPAEHARQLVHHRRPVQPLDPGGRRVAGRLLDAEMRVGARAEFVATSKEAFPAVNARRANGNATASAGLVFNPLKKEPRTALVIWR